jgi:hypothetical protein
MDYFKGYIYAVDSNGNIAPKYTNLTPPAPNSSNSFLVGAPLHFYFGLKKGKTALDRFFSLYVTGEIDND